MIRDIAFVLYVSAIPIVPLCGYDHFRKKDSASKALVCIMLFVMQTLLSLGCILSYFGLA